MKNFIKRSANSKRSFTVILVFIIEAFSMPGSIAQVQQRSPDNIINAGKADFNESSESLHTALFRMNGIPNENLEKYSKDKSNFDSGLPAWPLEKCYDIALEQNINVKQEQNNISERMLDRKTAQYSLLPSASYDMGHYFSFGKNIDPVTNAFSYESFSGGYTALRVDLELFSGFKKINTIKQSSLLVKASEYNKKKTELELLTNVTLIYARLLLDKEELKNERNIIENTAKELNIINEKIKVGRLSKYEFYAFNARLNTEQADLVTLQNDSLNTLQDLKQLLNISYKEKFDIAFIDEAVLPGIYAADFSEASLVERILLAHPAIRQAEANEKAAGIQVKIAKSNFLPSISVGGNVVSNYNADQKDINGGKIPLSTQINNNLGKNININLSIPIFSQMQNVNHVKKEKINISNAQLETENAKNLVATNVLHLINDFNSAKEKYKATLSAFEQNNLSYNLYVEKYRLGQISSVELITAQDIRNVSTSKYLESKLDLYLRFQLLELLKRYSAE